MTKSSLRHKNADTTRDIMSTSGPRVNFNRDDQENQPRKDSEPADSIRFLCDLSVSIPKRYRACGAANMVRGDA